MGERKGRRRASPIDHLLLALQGLPDSMGLGPMPLAVTVRRGLTCDRNDETERDMKGKDTRSRRGRPEGDASELGVVRVFSKPAPDAEDRLRRLFTLLLKHAARERQAAPKEDSLPEAELDGDHIEAEA